MQASTFELPDQLKVRGLLDSPSGILYADDAQVVALHIRKVYAGIESAPHANITVSAD